MAEAVALPRDPVVDLRRYARYFVISSVAAVSGSVLAVSILRVARLAFTGPVESSFGKLGAGMVVAVLMVSQMVAVGGLCCAAIIGVTWLVRRSHIN